METHKQATKNYRQRVGQRGEDAAAQHLCERGWTVIARNWRCRFGEIDIIASDGHALVVVEVKTRTSSRLYGDPSVAVTPQKYRRLRRLAGLWLAEQDVSWPSVRFDIVAVRLDDVHDAVAITHTRGVF